MGRKSVSIRISDELFSEVQASGKSATDYLSGILEKGSQAFSEAAGRPAPRRENGFQFGSEYQAPEVQEPAKHQIYGFQRYCYEEGCNEENKNFMPATVACDSCGLPRARIDLRRSDLDERLAEMDPCPICSSNGVVKGSFELSRDEWERLKGSE